MMMSEWLRLGAGGIAAFMAAVAVVRITRNARLIRRSGINGEIAHLSNWQFRQMFIRMVLMAATAYSGLAGSPRTDRRTLVLVAVLGLWLTVWDWRARAQLEVLVAERIQRTRGRSWQ